MTPFNRSGIRYVAKIPKGEKIVDMVFAFGTTVFVATDCRVYRLAQRRKGHYKLIPVEFVEKKE